MKGLQLLQKFYLIKMQHQNNHLISVIVPVYNRSNVIARTISSVLAQTYQNFELIIIDDGSTDDLDKEISKFSDKRILFLKLSKNKGVAAARNFGISNSNGQAIVFLDSDDELYPEYIYKMTEKLYSNNNEIVICRAKYNEDKIQPNKIDLKDFLKANSKLDYLLMGNIFPLPSILFTKQTLSNINFDNLMKSYEDFDFILNVFKNNQDLSILNDVLIKINDSPKSLNKNIPDIYSALKIIQAKHEATLKNNKVTNFYFKKNILSICNKYMRFNEKISVIYYLISNREFLSYSFSFIQRIFFRSKKI